jgi:hypothetical protein
MPFCLEIPYLCFDIISKILLQNPGLQLLLEHLSIIDTILLIIATKLPENLKPSLLTLYAPIYARLKHLQWATPSWPTGARRAQHQKERYNKL